MRFLFAFMLLVLLSFPVNAQEMYIVADPSEQGATHYKLKLGDQTIVRETIDAQLKHPISEMPYGIYVDSTAYYGKPEYKFTTTDSTFTGDIIWSDPSDPFAWERPESLLSPKNFGLKKETTE